MCSVDGCDTKRGSGVIIFRCPKNEARCQIWKTQLGFTGDHRYSYLSPEECYNKIKICSLHFADDSFISLSKQRLNCNALPTLICKSTISSNECSTIKMEVLEDEVKYGFTQMDTGSQINMCTPTFETQTNFTNNAVSTFSTCNPTSPNTIKMEVFDHELKYDPTPSQMVDWQKAVQATQAAQTQTNIINKEDKSLQTTSKLSWGSPREIALKRQVGDLKKDYLEVAKKLKTELTLSDVEKFLKDHYPEKFYIFLKTQLSLLKKAPRGTRYTNQFKQFALSMYFLLGPKIYKKMSTLWRLPSKRTLQRFTENWIIHPGFSDVIFQITKLRVFFLEEKSKDCVLCIDEMLIKPNLFYDISKDKVIGFQGGFNNKSPHIANNVLVLMVRGITSNWRQPIAYYFYQTSTTSDELKSILFESIKRLNQSGLNVVGVISTHDSNFYKFVKTTLGLTENNPTFLIHGKRLVYMFDIPHLLKSTRNIFFTHKLTINDKETNKLFLANMYEFDKHKEHRLVPILSHGHIFPNKADKMKINLATEIFSDSVALAMFTYIDFKVLPPEAKPTAEFIEKMNRLRDTLQIQSSDLNTLDNSKTYSGSTSQILFLKEMTKMFKNVIIKNVDGKNVTKQFRFIFGWRLTINAIYILFKILQKKKYTNLPTGNLNINCFQHFFGQIKSRCSHYKKPTSIQFCRSFKQIFKLHYLAQTDGTRGIEDVLLNITPDVLERCNQTLTFTSPTYSPLKVFAQDYRNLKTPEGSGLLPVVKYLLSTCLLQHSCEICKSVSDSDTLDERNVTFCELKVFSETSDELIKECDNVIEYVSALENVFISKFGELACQENIGRNLKNYFANVKFTHPCKDFPLDYFLSLYVRVRIYFTLKFANQYIKTCQNNKMEIKLSILQDLIFF